MDIRLTYLGSRQGQRMGCYSKVHHKTHHDISFCRGETHSENVEEIKDRKTAKWHSSTSEETRPGS